MYNFLRQSHNRNCQDINMLITQSIKILSDVHLGTPENKGLKIGLKKRGGGGGRGEELLRRIHLVSHHFSQISSVHLHRNGQRQHLKPEALAVQEGKLDV